MFMFNLFNLRFFKLALGSSWNPFWPHGIRAGTVSGTVREIGNSKVTLTFICIAISPEVRFDLLTKLCFRLTWVWVPWQSEWWSRSVREAR